MSFATPVAIAANTIYVASYYAPAGGYADDYGYFATAGVTSGPLHALADGVSGGDGVYVYGAAGTFPTASYHRPTTGSTSSSAPRSRSRQP